MDVQISEAELTALLRDYELLVKIAAHHANPKLRAGYLLDGLERLDRKPAAPERLTSFVASADAATQARQRSAGLGEDVRLHGEGVVGSGLELEGELLQLCAFTGGGRSGRMAPPSRRG